jgi:uncharacterized LabA/DUF88 family protein
MSPKKRVIAYIDGFNVYHAIANNLPEKYKWLNYRKFVESFLDADEILDDIFLFTASPRWDTERMDRHSNYMRILALHLGIKIISGNYTNVKRNFNGKVMPVVFPENTIVSPQKFVYKTHEEKQTDVNIALAIFEGAMTDRYDRALIFSGDSDIAPAIILSRRYKSDKSFTCILPYRGRGHVISRTCDTHRSTTLPILDDCLLDNTITLYDQMYINPYNDNKKETQQ